MPTTVEATDVKIRALVVDDSVTLRRLMELTLRPLGIEVDFAERGGNAFVMVKAGNYDIVFLDVMLPGVDGYSVCKAIKADKGLRHIPIIMLTSRDSALDKVRGTMAGADVYLTKPLERGAMLAAMKKCLPQMELLASGNTSVSDKTP